MTYIHLFSYICITKRDKQTLIKMTTFHVFSRQPLQVIKCTKVTNGYKWESFTFCPKLDSEFSIEFQSFRPDECHNDILFCTEEDFDKVKDAVLSQLNLMILPIQKVCTTAFDISLFPLVY